MEKKEEKSSRKSKKEWTNQRMLELAVYVVIAVISLILLFV